MKAPDLHKKRFRYNKYFTHVVSEEVYKKWREENPHLKDKINSFQSFSKYWTKIAKAIVSEVCINPNGVKLPYYCGELSIKYANIDLKPVNKRASIIMQKSIPHLNWNTSERLGKLVFNIKRASKFNAMIAYYGFKGTRVFNVAVNKAMIENPENFKVYSVSSTNTKELVNKLKEIEKQRSQK